MTGIDHVEYSVRAMGKRSSIKITPQSPYATGRSERGLNKVELAFDVTQFSTWWSKLVTHHWLTTHLLCTLMQPCRPDEHPQFNARSRV